MSFGLTVEVFFGLLGVIIFALAFIFLEIYERRQVQMYKGLQMDKVYYCRQCQTLYTSKFFEKSQVCPKCGQNNVSLRF